jgi:hypothetical protein
VPTCARRRDFAFDRLELMSLPAEDGNAGSSTAAEHELSRLSAALAPAARQFGGVEGRGGCLLCCGTANSGKEQLLDLGKFYWLSGLRQAQAESRLVRTGRSSICPRQAEVNLLLILI